MNPALKELEKIFFPVRKVEADPDKDHASWLSHEILVDRPGSKKPLRVNICSEDYNLVPNKKLLTPIVEKLSENYTIEAEVVMKEWSKFYINFIFKDNNLRGATKKDILFPMLRIYNSYDGSMKYSFYFAIWRLICENGAKAIIPDSVKQGKFMHTPQLGEESEDGHDTATLLLEKVENFIGISKDVAAAYKPLIESTRTESEALEVMTEVQQQTSYPKKLVEHAYARLQHEAHELRQPINDYLVYNALNYALFNAGQSELPDHKKDKKDQEVLDYLLAELPA